MLMVVASPVINAQNKQLERQLKKEYKQKIKEYKKKKH